MISALSVQLVDSCITMVHESLTTHPANTLGVQAFSLSRRLGGADQNHRSLSGEGLGTVAGPMVLAVLPGGLPKRKFVVLPFLGRVSEREELSEESLSLYYSLPGPRASKCTQNACSPIFRPAFSLSIGPGEGRLVVLHEALVGVVVSL